MAIALTFMLTMLAAIPVAKRMASIETPCIRTCVVDPASRLCIGCGRSLGEIARWLDLSVAERTTIMKQLPARLAARSAAAGGKASAAGTGPHPAVTTA